MCNCVDVYFCALCERLNHLDHIGVQCGTYKGQEYIDMMGSLDIGDGDSLEFSMRVTLVRIDNVVHKIVCRTGLQGVDIQDGETIADNLHAVLSKTIPLYEHYNWVLGTGEMPEQSNEPLSVRGSSMRDINSDTDEAFTNAVINAYLDLESLLSVLMGMMKGKR